jgi:3-methylcrotonyl-CoA carboxylase alpha subunit
MIAMLVVHAESRAAAIDALAGNCEGVEVWPVQTNAAFLARALAHPEFRTGAVTTSFIATHEQELVADEAALTALREDAAIALVVREIDPVGPVYGTVTDELRFKRPGEVWRQQTGFRLNAPDRIAPVFATDGPMEAVAMPRGWRDRFVSSETVSDGIVVFAGGDALHARTRAMGGASGGTADGAVLAPMPGRVTAVEVAAGDSITKGQRLVTLEAMKMEHGLVAPFDGTVAELNAEPGAQVSEGALLVRVEKAA